VVTPRSLANLTPFKSGIEWTGNAGGRPKKRPISDRLRELAESPLDLKACKRLKLSPGATVGDAIAAALGKEAIRGKVPAVREFREAVEGKATSRIEVIGGVTHGPPNVATTVLEIRRFYGLLEEESPGPPRLPER